MASDPNLMFVGTWHIQEMELWDEDYFNMERQAFIDIQSDCSGNFQFGLVNGDLTGEYRTVDDENVFAFTWNGNDENDPADGGGWLQLIDEEALEGEFTFFSGDSSTFFAVRA